MKDPDRLSQQISFLMEADKLKQIYRQSLLSDGSREENDAEHSWHLALMVVLLNEYANEPGLDILKTVKMVLIHDIVEIDAGDTFIYDTVHNTSKSKREKKAAARIFGILPPDQELEFRQLWEEFEARETPEAKFAAVFDRLQPLLLNYRTAGHTWKKYGITSSRVINKNEHVSEGSAQLWEYIKDLLERCIEKGYLKRG